MIQPSYRMMLMYDIRPDRFERYYRYMLGEFVPTLRQMGLYMLFAWQVHGKSFDRQIEFVCESKYALRDALDSEQFRDAEERLRTYTTEYNRKIVQFQDRYQC